MYLSGVKEVLKLAMAGKTEEAKAQVHVVVTGANKLNEGVEELAQIKEKVGKQTFEQSGEAYAHARLILIVIASGGCLLGLAIGYGTAQVLVKPLKLMTATARRLANGDVSQKIEYQAGDEIGQLAESLRQVLAYFKEAAGAVDSLARGDLSFKLEVRSENDSLTRNVQATVTTLQGLQKELQRLTQASRDGALSERGKPEQFQGAYADVVRGTNAMLDAILLPIGEGNRILAQISSGKIDELIAQTYKGDHEKMKQAVNHVATTLQGLQKELQRLTQASRDGALSERGKPEQFQGAYADIVRGTNAMLDAILLPIGEGNRILAQISSGKIDELIAQTYKGDHEKMKQAVNHVATTLQGLQNELQRLTQASRDGALSERGKPEQFQGAYADIVRGTNAMLDAILLPIGEGNRILRLIRGGNLREKVEIDCKGDHKAMKDAVNGVHDWLSGLIAYVTKIANGDLTATIEKASADDQIHEWLLLVKTNIAALVTDANLLVQTAVAGKLATRADASKHQGDYRKIIQGFNDTLDAVIEPINESAAVLQQIATGDLTVRVLGNYQGDLAAMKNNMNKMAEDLSRSLTEVRDVADTLTASAQQMSAASEEISSGAQEQASSLEETASSLEEISTTIKHNADNSQQARQLANTAHDVADKGGAVVHDAVTAMGEINQSSKKIADIITAIDEIAFQTNLLALNAAVEAARAGEQGRGFAVVAAEVRNLAQRSATAAKEIKSLIQDSVRKVENGSELVTRSGQSLQEIVTSVKRVTDIVSEIAAASREQSAGVEQVSKAVAQMDTVTQANASQTEELSGTAESLTSQAEQLQGLVARFRLEAETAGRKAALEGSHARPSAESAAKKAVRKATTAPQKKAETARSEGNGNGHELALLGVGGSHQNKEEDGFKEF